VRLEDLGLHRLRHLSRPAHVFRVLAGGGHPAAPQDSSRSHPQPPLASGSEPA
jgi:hypothetical protein